MHRTRKVDSNQADLVKQIRKIPGVSVALTHTVGNGFPDAAVGFRGRTYLIEIKDPEKFKSQRKLTPEEISFHNAWTGHVRIIEKLDDIIEMLFNRTKID